MIVNKITQDIIKGNLKDVFSTFDEFFKSLVPISGQIINLQSRYNTYLTEKALGTTDEEDMEVNQRQIVAALIDTKGKVEEKLNEFLDWKSMLPETQSGFEERIKLKISEHYEILGELTRGNSAILYLAEERLSGRKLVVKAFTSYDFVDKKSVVKGEIERIKSVKHRNIINVSHVFYDDYPYCIILEYVNGIDLKKIISISGRRTLRDTQALLLKILDTLNYLHQRNIFQNDLNPDRILIDEEGEPMISPFAVFKINANLRTLNQIIDDLRYLSPEQLESSSLLGSRASSQFSLGALAFYLLTGKNLFEGDDVRKIVRQRYLFLRSNATKRTKFNMLIEKQVPHQFIAVLERLLQRDPEKRYGSIKEVISEIEKCPVARDVYRDLTRDSFERCVLGREAFLETFYQRLIQSSEKAREMLGKVDLKRQSRKLFYAINFIIESSPESRHLKDVVAMPTHEGLVKEDYFIFLETFYELVQEQEEKNNRWSPQLAAAWEEIIKNAKEEIARSL